MTIEEIASFDAIKSDILQQIDKAIFRRDQIEDDIWNLYDEKSGIAMKLIDLERRIGLLQAMRKKYNGGV